MERSRTRWLTAIPVFNEVQYVDRVLDEVGRYAEEVLVVDDGSIDGTSEILEARQDIRVVRHPKNLGYGAALATAFEFSIAEGYAGLVTLDCDGQHQPKRIPRFIEAGKSVDIVSGSRYLKQYEGDDAPPPERLFINRCITAEINQRLGLELTDAFCGFKAYRRNALEAFEIDDPGYAMPLQLWVQAAAAGLSVMELPVPLIYLDENRSFGGALDHGETRLKYYREVLDRSIAWAAERGVLFPERSEQPCAGQAG